MKDVLIFAGTTEGRRLSEYLVQAGIPHTLCVATAYGAQLLTEHPLCHIRCGRMDAAQIRQLLEATDFSAVVDATHPYAVCVTEQIQEALAGRELPYLRLVRACGAPQASQEQRLVYFASHEACAQALTAVHGKVLLTIGSKELAVYCADRQLRQRLLVRVLPAEESLRGCAAQGLDGRQLLAMHGPFSAELNEALLRQYDIRCLVTKQSGSAGGYEEKVQAAARCGIPLFVIGRPKEADCGGYSFDEVCARLEQLYHTPILQTSPMELTLAGSGMGAAAGLTVEVQEAIAQADILLGAPRLLEGFCPRIEKQPYYQAQQICPYLQQMQAAHPFTRLRVVILFSGDSGFYSGAQEVLRALRACVADESLTAQIRVLPGISSVAYLAACVGESYEQAAIYSMHGRRLSHLARRIRSEAKTFLLLSGADDVRWLGETLLRAGLSACSITVGSQLSYPNEHIETLTPEACAAAAWETQPGLYTCLIQNPQATKKRLTHGMADACFLRARVPMTKEEVREVSICKLRLHAGAIVYDIGSGSGSLAVEVAALSAEVFVYAIEKKAQAAALIQKNKEQFLLENIQVVEAAAPEGLEKLTPATHAIIGGSGGALESIVRTLYEKNPHMRVVLHAISMETLSAIQALLRAYPVCDEELVQLQVSRMKPVGSYHLMQAENPVWLCAFTFAGEGEYA